MLLLEVKRTWSLCCEVSAYDPKGKLVATERGETVLW